MANDLEAQLRVTLGLYSRKVAEGLRKAADKVTKEGVERIRAASPHRKGRYAEGWARKIERGELTYTVTIHNKSHWQITHLLENGHATRNGGYVNGTPHIKPVEEYAVEEFAKQAEKIIKSGG